MIKWEKETYTKEEAQAIVEQETTSTRKATESRAAKGMVPKSELDEANTKNETLSGEVETMKTETFNRDLEEEFIHRKGNPKLFKAFSALHSDTIRAKEGNVERAKEFDNIVKEEENHIYFETPNTTNQESINGKSGEKLGSKQEQQYYPNGTIKKRF